jgi:16S rRNA (uracil1498-N3)-methyltransferase
MRLTRIHVPGPWAAGERLALGADAAVHLTRVLRLKSGAPLAVFDGQGREHAASIHAIAGTRVEVQLGEARATPAPSPLAVTLAQGISRAERMDYAIQKATELGVARIVPLLCERSVVRLDAAQAARKLEHWQGVAIAAAGQCGRADLPEILPAQRLAEHLAAIRGTPGMRLVLDPAAPRGLKDLPATRAVEILIGPEGGLADEEISLAGFAGFERVRLGPRVLRTETAAAAAIAALQTLQGDLG